MVGADSYVITQIQIYNYVHLFSFITDADSGYPTTTLSMTFSTTSSTSSPNITVLVLAVTVVVCVITLLFATMLVLWLCLCCTGRIHLQRRTSESKKKQHIYETVSDSIVTSTNTPKLVTLNPAYGCRQTQPEPKSQAHYLEYSQMYI